MPLTKVTFSLRIKKQNEINNNAYKLFSFPKTDSIANRNKFYLRSLLECNQSTNGQGSEWSSEITPL